MIPEFATTLLSIKDVARDTKVFRFSKPEGWTFVPGQFLSLKFTETAFRAYSIASLPADDEIELVVRYVKGGVGSEALWAATVGQDFVFRGAFGHFGLSENTDRAMVCCCTGTGIAPMRSMVLAEQRQKNPRKIWVLYGGKDAQDLAYLDEIADWGGNVWLGLSQETDADLAENLAQKMDGRVNLGRITEFLEADDWPWGSDAEFYLCGNGGMVQGVRELLESCGVAKGQIFQERFN